MHMNRTDGSRREFLVAIAGAAILRDEVIAQTSAASATGLPTRVLGRTGVRVSVLGLGGAHIGRVKDDGEAIRIMHAALDEGMTFMDNAWEYNKGRSEDLMGKALAMDGRRKKAFLMTKVCSREYRGAMEQLEDSLRKLQTDYLDLWQFHECNYHNDPEWVIEKGALRAATEARKQGKVRFIGFTGHKSPAIHLSMLRIPFDWDASQMPNNVMDSGFLSFRHEVMPVCLDKKVGIVGMKGCGGDGLMIEKGAVTLEECYRYCLSQPVSVQVVGLNSMDDLRRALEMARSHRPMTDAEQTALARRVKDAMGDGRFELFKTSKRFDSAYHRLQHGFETVGV
jgi:aryl-alcohol dehydrogenase-like predicted oxidoreductase